MPEELLLNSVADGVFGVDGDGRITFANPAALRMLGYGLGELLGHDADARLHHPGEEHREPGASGCPFELALRQAEAPVAPPVAVAVRDPIRMRG